MRTTIQIQMSHDPADVVVAHVTEDLEVMVDVANFGNLPLAAIGNDDRRNFIKRKVEDHIGMSLGGEG